MNRVFIEEYRVERAPQRFYEFMFTCAPFLEEQKDDEIEVDKKGEQE